MKIPGTSHFASETAAAHCYRGYYGGHGAARHGAAREIAAGQIHIGPPPVKDGERIVTLDGGARYGIEEASK